MAKPRERRRLQHRGYAEMTSSVAIESALRHLDAGEVHRAEQIFREVLAVEPKSPPHVMRSGWVFPRSHCRAFCQRNAPDTSLVSAVGMSELVSYSQDEYVRTASSLAEDLSRLGSIRSTLRNRMLASPLMDAQRFARNMENAFRDMWRCLV